MSNLEKVPDARESAWRAYNSSRPHGDVDRKTAFFAGWNARKQLDYEAALDIKRPLHASAYEPLTPFKPRPALLGDTHFGDDSPPLAEQLVGRKVVVMSGGDQVHGKLHDD